MKAEMNQQGQLVLTPESWAEHHAMQAWSEGNKVHVDDVARMEKHHYRGSCLKVVSYTTPSST